MPRKNSPSTLDQTAIGNENVQVVGSSNVITRVTNFFAGATEQQRAKRNRRAMLELVKNTWIKGVLEKSLYNEVLIELGMEERPGAVDRPWDIQVQMPNAANHTLPPGTSMIDVFDAMNGSMLILGEPGSGKTTMLLELARDCIARAEQDDNQSLPVVFNLSSWDGSLTIDAWLINELRTKYNVPKKTAENWVVNDDLQLLLDGLDEVKQGRQDVCVKAINDYRQKHGLTVPIAVCSRIAEYEGLNTKLGLGGAVLLQPLTLQQIEEYFEQAGSELEAAHQTLKNDEILQELVKVPLILSILALAYQGKPVEAAVGKRLDTIETRRKHLFDTYIQKMFERFARTKYNLYSPEHIKRWLGWLAQKMIEHNAVPFLLENMQPKWLSQKKGWLYRLIIGLVSGLVFGLIIGWIFRLLVGPTTGQIFGLTSGLVFGLFRGLSSWRTNVEEINMVDALSWSWKEATKGLVFGVIFGLSIWLIFGPSFGLVVGSSIVLVCVLLGGIQVKSASQTLYAGQRFFFSMRNFLFISLLGGLIFGLVFGFLSGPLIGLFFGFLFGGIAVIQHYTLRYIIAKDNLLPFRLIPFLDYCVDRIFLRRVGGGYIFVHRLLMEHFAAMYPESEK